jgi:hypothetical protein
MVSTTLPFPAGTLTRSHRAYVCVREPQPDAFGRPDEREHRCGDPELARAERGTPTAPSPAPAPGTAPAPSAPGQPRDYPWPYVPPGGDPKNFPGDWSFTMVGPPEDPITQGQSFGYGDPDNITIYPPSRGEIQFNFGSQYDGRSWGGRFMLPAGQEFTAGTTYTGGSPSGGGPEFSVTGNGRGCQTTTGEFTVEQLDRWPDGGLRRFRISFVQTCNGAAGTARGVLSYESAADWGA